MCKRHYGTAVIILLTPPGDFGTSPASIMTSVFVREIRPTYLRYAITLLRLRKTSNKTLVPYGTVRYRTVANNKFSRNNTIHTLVPYRTVPVPYLYRICHDGVQEH